METCVWFFIGLVDEQQKVRTISALAIAALAEAATPYGIESFDSVLKPLWKGIRQHRGKVDPSIWFHFSFYFYLLKWLKSNVTNLYFQNFKIGSGCILKGYWVSYSPHGCRICQLLYQRSDVNSYSRIPISWWRNEENCAEGNFSKLLFRICQSKLGCASTFKENFISLQNIVY